VIVNAKGLLCWKSHIVVLDQDDLWLQVLHLKHDHILAGHLGQLKTVELVQQEYFWP